VTVNANLVVRSSCMLIGVGCEGKLRFVMKGIVSFICGLRCCNFFISVGQTCKFFNFCMVFLVVFRDFDARFILQACCEIVWEFSVILNS
jgi:hypothetical protein